MRRMVTILIGVGLCLLAPIAAARAALAIYVSPSGDDHWSGQLETANAGRTDGPVASLVRARDLIRAEAPHAGAEVVIAGGTYFLDSNVEFSNEDSGSREAPIVYRAREGQEVRLIGGREVNGFSPVKAPAILARLAPAARQHVLQADLTAQGIRDFGHLRSRGFGRPGAPAAMELFFRGEPMTLAR